MHQGMLGETCAVYNPFHDPNILLGVLGSLMWVRGASPWTGTVVTPLDANGTANLHGLSSPCQLALAPPSQLTPPPLFSLFPPGSPLQHPSAGGGPVDDNNDNTFHTPLGNALDLLDEDFEMHNGFTNVLGEIVREHEKGDYIPGIVASCSKELLRVHSMTPRVWPNWHSIGHDDPQVSKHAWHNKVHAWEALGDHSCDLSVVPDPSTGPLTVDLPSPAPVPPPAPVLPSPPGIASTSSTQMSEFRDKGRGKAVAVDLVPEVEGSRKRKSPMISGHSSQPPKSAMKSRKHAKSTQPVKSAPDVESEDEEDTILQPISHGVLEVVLPQLSTIVVRAPQLPHSPGSPKKQNSGPASKTAGSRLEVMKSPISRPEATPTSGSRLEVVKPTDDTAGASDGEHPVIPPFDIMVPGPIPQNNPCHYCVKEDWHCETHVDRRTGHPCLSCVRCATKKIKCQPASMGTPPKCIRGKATTQQTRSKTPAPATSSGLSASQSRTQTCSQSCGVSRTPVVPPATTPKVQLRGRSKTTGRKTPAPAPATAAVLSSSYAVVDQHPSFPLPDLPANATFLLDQSVPPPSMSPLPSTLPNLINLDMGVMEPTPLKVENTSDMVGLMFEPSQVQPEGPQSSGEIVVPDDPGNLFPEYNSVSEEMDVEVKAGTSGEEVEMAT
ncbi:hypothetical protein EDD22DRAFT_844473 [Suillus occidentalis]|nr:hypothetical protein EDD22DRAFT_844473 [Suillus occidentalis]